MQIRLPQDTVKAANDLLLTFLMQMQVPTNDVNKKMCHEMCDSLGVFVRTLINNSQKKMSGVTSIGLVISILSYGAASLTTVREALLKQILVQLIEDFPEEVAAQRANGASDTEIVLQAAEESKAKITLDL